MRKRFSNVRLSCGSCLESHKIPSKICIFNLCEHALTPFVRQPPFRLADIFCLTEKIFLSKTEGVA